MRAAVSDGAELGRPGAHRWRRAGSTVRLWYHLAMVNPTPAQYLVDRNGRPYFLWDCQLTLEQFERGLRDSDSDVRAYLVGKLMRQAKPDDVFSFVSPRTIRELWPRLERYLGQSREFWTWLFETWEAQGRVWRR